MKNKICLVTGATAGIGEVTALRLAEMGAMVVGVGRNPAKCEVSQARIRKETGNPNVEYLVADLSSQAQIRTLAETFRQKYARLDVLVNNAGAIFLSRQLSADGIEKTFALNHLGYFLLTNLLLDLLKSSAPARIINVSSTAHMSGDMNFNDLGYEHGRYTGWSAYARSKLANVLFTYELARRLNGSNITVNTLHPGFVASDFAFNNFRGLLWPVRPFYWLFQKFSAITPEEGADTMIYLASAPEVAGTTGKYFYKRREKRTLEVSYDEEVAKKLWEISEKMVGS
ncbi:MAG: SDR family oxidoreductase [Anaerolineales bacterium]|nr:SDR family oxidoreductase [Anaerolineales bacterium]